MDALQIGSTIGDYQIVGILGAGGMGKVYKVRNVISDRVEAMKVLLPDLVNQPDLADRFLREIKVQASLEHPNIATLHTAVRANNQLLMLMEFVDGITLEQRLKAGPLPVEQAVDYISQVLSALDYAHKHGVIHRDIKPPNMMLTPVGVVKLMDFGIAKASSDHKLTMTGTTMGSLYYMSPEQIQGSAALDARADLYSVGVSLYELVTGKRPFDGDSQFAIMSAHLEKTPVPPIAIDPRLPQALNDVILLSVAKDPNGRFQTAGAFRNALGNVLPARPAITQPAAAPMPQPVAAASAPAPARSGRRGLWMAIGALATAAVVIAAIEFGPWTRTKAAQQGVAPVMTQGPASVAPPNPAPVAIQQPAGQVVSGPKREPAPAPQVSPQPPAPVPQQPQQQAQQPKQNPVQQLPAQAAPPTVTQQAPAVVPQPAPAPAQQPQQPAVSRADLQQVREQLMLLNTRAETIHGSLDNMQRQQAASGLGMRADVREAASLMNSYIQGARDALAASDIPSAKDFMEKADRQAKFLEKFFNK